MFKDKQAREDIAELKRLLGYKVVQRNSFFGISLYDLYNYNTPVLEKINKLFELAKTLGYEYKEESKEAGWVKKRLPENVTTNVSPGGSGCTGGGAGGECMFTSVPEKTDEEYAEEFMKSDKHGNSGYPIIIRFPKTKKPKKSKSK